MPSFLNELLGSKPRVPDLPSLSLSTEQQKALAANVAAIPGAEKIATQVDLFNQQQVDKMLENVIPNYKAITGNINQNIQQLTAGQIPSDVTAAIQQATAGQALAGGYGGSQAGANLTARDLGLTSLQLTQQGLASAQSWLQTANSLYAPGQFNVSSMFVTPSQQAAFDVEERNAQFQRQWMQNQIAAQPAMWAQDFKEAVEAAISLYGGAEPQHAGTIPVQSSGLSTNMNFGSGFSDYAAGGGMDTGDVPQSGGDTGIPSGDALRDPSGFGGFA